jgi:hypothetical protein
MQRPDGEFVMVPMDMAQDLRQWAEALSLVEGWTLESHGTQVLRRYKALLTAAALGGEVAGTMQSDGSWSCVCGENFATDLGLYAHRQAKHFDSKEVPDGG